MNLLRNRLYFERYIVSHSARPCYCSEVRNPSASGSAQSDCCLGQHHKGGQNWSIFSKHLGKASKENS